MAASTTRRGQALLNGQGRLTSTYADAMALGAHTKAWLRQPTDEAFKQKHRSRLHRTFPCPRTARLREALVTKPGINTVQDLADSEGIAVGRLVGCLRRSSQSFVGHSGEAALDQSIMIARSRALTTSPPRTPPARLTPPPRLKKLMARRGRP